MVTSLLSVDPVNPDPGVIARAAACLRDGGLVAFPTETVYGLGVNALDASAVRRLFTAKNRPASDPLIVHVADTAAMARVARAVPEMARQLGERFWPGPLTLVMPRDANMPQEVTAGGDTVAVRIPKHAVALALLRTAGMPVAAPSANLFSRPSPTRASHVRDDLDGRIDMILDGGPTTVGVESTVLDLTMSPPTVWRPGAVTLEMLREIVPDAIAAVASGADLNVGHDDTVGRVGPYDGSVAPSPGLLSKHYAPRAPLTLYEGPRDRVAARMADDAQALEMAGKRVGMLTWGDRPAQSVAAEMYAALREMDAAGVDVILASAVDGSDGLVPALLDRLRRAAAGRVVRP